MIQYFLFNRGEKCLADVTSTFSFKSAREEFSKYHGKFQIIWNRNGTDHSKNVVFQ